MLKEESFAEMLYPRLPEHSFVIGDWVKTKKGYYKVEALTWDIFENPQYILQNSEIVSEADVEKVSGFALILLRRNILCP